MINVLAKLTIQLNGRTLLLFLLHDFWRLVEVMKMERLLIVDSSNLKLGILEQRWTATMLLGAVVVHRCGERGNVDLTIDAISRC